MKTKPRKPMALLLIGAMLLGVLPLTGHSVSRASGEGVSNPRITDDVSTWDCVWFGNYWQGDTNGDGKADQNDRKQPIKWRVLSVDGDDAFLLADKNLDCQRYNNTPTDVTWETCTMRSWLNGYGASANVCGTDYTEDNFMANAFSSGEQSAINSTTVVNEDNPEYKTEGGNSTQDKVYLLSVGEVTNPAYGFTTSYSEKAKSRRVENSDYAKAQGAWTSTSTENAGKGYWWLRSPGLNSSNASGVGSNGDYVCGSGSDVHNNDYAVRPALHLNLSSASGWSYAGTVSSEEIADEQASPTPEESPEPTAAPTTTVLATPTAFPKPIVVPTSKSTVSPTVAPVPIGSPTANVIPATQLTASPVVSPVPIEPSKPTSAPTTSPAASELPVASGKPAAPSTGLPGVTPTATISGEKQQDNGTETGNSVSSPGKPVIKSVKSKKGRKIKITLKRDVKGAAGYQIQYARNKKFTKAKKSEDVGKWTSAKTIAGLKKGKTYYVRVRAYQKQSGKKIYGKWSRAKKVKINK